MTARDALAALVTFGPLGAVSVVGMVRRPRFDRTIEFQGFRAAIGRAVTSQERNEK